MSTQLPARSSGAPWCGVARNTMRTQPGHARRRPRLVQRAARHQAAHAVAHQVISLHRHRPRRAPAPPAGGKSRPLREMCRPRVVVQIDRRVAQVARQRLPVVALAAQVPLQVVHAQAVDQHQRCARWPRASRRPAPCGSAAAPPGAAAPWGWPAGSRWPPGGRRSRRSMPRHRFALLDNVACTEQRREFGQRAVYAVTDDPGDPTDAGRPTR